MHAKFFIVSAASAALRRAGQRDKIGEMQERVEASGSYDAALQVVMEYVELDFD